MNAQLFQSWADIVIMAVLAISYIVTFIAQRNTINTLKDRIDAFEKTNKAAESLTEMQSSHIETYKNMIDITEIEKYVEMKAATALVEMIKDKEELIKIVKESASEVINPKLLSQIHEETRFIWFMFNDILKFEKTVQREIITKYIPEYCDMMFIVFDNYDQVETEKNLN